MAISRKRLGDDELVVLSTHRHVKALLLPALVLFVVAVVAGLLTSFASGEARDLLQLVIWLVALPPVLLFVVKPVLVWLGDSYTVTSRRLVSRSGLVSRRRRVVDLDRVTDVGYERGLVDRVLGCGTLVVTEAGPDGRSGRVRLRDVPHVEQVHRRLADQLSAPRRSDATWADDRG